MCDGASPFGAFLTSTNDAPCTLHAACGADSGRQGQVGQVGQPRGRRGEGLRLNVVIFEVAGGTDKGSDGHRRDTMPIAEGLLKRGWRCEVIQYDDALVDKIYAHVLETADGFLSRINPGKYPQYTESTFFDMARKLADQGLVAMPHPDAMINYGAKDALVKLAGTAAGLPDTYAYYDMDSLRTTFPTNIASGVRVLKQNRGSTGEGIWVVRPHGWEHGRGVQMTPHTLLECTEMVDNHTDIRELGEFMEFCEQYVQGEDGQLVDQRFLPRIVEGEIRVLMIHDQPIKIVHKRPAEGHVSATLFSGATYTYDPPSAWPVLVDYWLSCMPAVRRALGGFDYPIIWTADFIVDTAPDGSDVFRLGEINCSCVGVTSELHLCDTIAEAIVDIVTKKKAEAVVVDTTFETELSAALDTALDTALSVVMDASCPERELAGDQGSVFAPLLSCR